MTDTAIHATLATWANFYLITGSAAAALTGLQFVVQTLLASDGMRGISSTDPEGGVAAFGSPTVVHFSIAMLLSAVVCAPWPAYAGLRLMLGAFGIGALIYATIVLGRTRRQTTYAPTAEDWIWHIILPVTSYAGVLLAAVRIEDNTESSLFALAGATLLLICVGIHNAWDTVTYLTVLAIHANAGREPAPPTPNKSQTKHSKARRR